jgi:hypothetical protein
VVELQAGQSAFLDFNGDLFADDGTSIFASFEPPPDPDRGGGQ